jgi:hypothetical protein
VTARGAGPDLFTYLYPWDVARLGADAVLGRLGDLGLAGVDLAANYHSIESFSPLGDTPSFFLLPRGAVFFPARPERYGAVKPLVWPDPDVVGAWRSVADRIERHGLALDAWTIGLFQPWMAQDFPGTARELPTGQRIAAGVCPASVDVVEYLVALVGDLTDQFPVRSVNLEHTSALQFDHGWVRPRRLTHLSPASRWLLGRCFCASCEAAASAEGLDVHSLRRRILERIGRDCRDQSLRLRPGSPREGPGRADVPPSPEQAAEELLDEDEELAAYLRLERAATVRLVRSVADTLAGTGTEVMAYVPFHDAPRAETLPDAVAEAVTGVRLNPAIVGVTPLAGVAEVVERTGRRLRRSAFAPGVGTEPIGPDELVSGGMLAALEETAGIVDEIALYHYGLLPSEVFDALVGAARQPVVAR